MGSIAEYTCAFCGEPNTIVIDLSGGFYQTYIEDCQVCCRPNQLYIEVDEDTLAISITTEYAG